MLVSIGQPAYLPWLGYFERIRLSDLHIVLDHVQYERRSFTNRNLVRTRTGVLYLTVPVKKEPRSHASIPSVRIDNSQNWSKRHLTTISHSYCNSDFFQDLYHPIHTLLSKEYRYLIDLLSSTTALLKEWLDITTPVLYSSQLPCSRTKGDLILELCKQVGATRYLSGPNGRDYINESRFSEQGVGVEYHDYEQPTYHQTLPVRSEGFLSNLSVIDLLFNQGPLSLGAA
jgi:hypothetical protein